MSRNFDSMQNASGGRSSGDLDLALAGRALLRNWPWLLLLSVAIGLAAYFWARSQPPVYRAEAVVLASNGQANSGVVNQTLVTAPPLPDGAAEQALHSSAVITAIAEDLQDVQQLTAPERASLISALETELQHNKITSLQIIPQIDPYGNGLYTLQADARTATAARILADTAATNLIRWDASRALEGIEKSAATLRAQIAEIERRLQTAGSTGVERQTLLSTRASLQENLARVSILLQAASGTLTRVSPAAQPFAPIAPQPLSAALLGGLLALLLGSALTAARALTDKTVKAEDDLLDFNIPTLGIIPRLRRRDVILRGIVDQGKSAGLYEAVGFLRVNILSMFQQQDRLRLTVSSTAPGEGKSSITATLADAFATAGKKVLIIDGDLRRGTQQQVWEKYSASHDWKPLVGTGGSRNLQDALKNPDHVQVLRVEPNVDLLPAGPGLHESLVLLTQLNLEAILDRWSEAYDIVLIDSPPLLAIADGLVLARYTDGIVLVTEARTTSLQAIRAALRRVERGGLHVLGFVLNKVDVQKDTSYSYSYTPRTTQHSLD